MKPQWIKVGDSEKELPIEEIQRLLIRTKKYLRDHLILDSYLEMANKLVSISQETSQQDWSSREIHELAELTLNGAKLKNIAFIMRKEIRNIKEKIESLNLQVKGD